MRLHDTSIPGVVVGEALPHVDTRGSFGRWFDRDAFAERGLMTSFDQDSFARNTHSGTIRGLHYQAHSDAETKIVVCVAGAAFDVVLDLRPGPTYGRHTVVDLRAAAWRFVYIPAGCAHGYQTLADDTTLLYRISGRYTPAAARGVRWDDPALGIAWPLAVSAISERDRSLPALVDADASAERSQVVQL